MTKNEKCIFVYVDWQELSSPTLLGYLHSTLSRGKEIYAFEYEKSWLMNNKTLTLDPALQLLQGRQYLSDKQSNFGIFLDSSPDRWGRFLMNRRESQLARQENRKPRTLVESDYLLGVYDLHRIGALRFKLNKTADFLDNNAKLAAPPWTSLRELENACLALENPDVEKDDHYLSWLNMLIAPGGSLGGARPKASVLDENQHLWIAKFPSRNDSYDVAVWEILVNTLAKKSGINVANAQLKKLNNHYHTFLTKRFDRNKHNQRIHFASAMTLLQHQDGDDATTGASYLEIAAFIQQYGASPQHDLEQLWRRIVFNICVSNTDDHLRNHGFLFSPNKGWELSPAYDMNPNSLGDGLKLNISDNDNAQDLNLARDVAKYFHIKPQQANDIIHQIIQITSTWQQEAKALNISRMEQDYMQRAFRIGEAETD